MLTLGAQMRFPSLLLAAFLFLGACGTSPHREGPAPSAGVCAVENETHLDISGLSNGVYGVVGNEVHREPIARFDQLFRVNEGREENGKPWIYFHLNDRAASNLRAFTATPEGKSIAVVFEGHLSSHHKVKAALTTSEMQLSCCDASACARWSALTPAR